MKIRMGLDQDLILHWELIGSENSGFYEPEKWGREEAKWNI